MILKRIIVYIITYFLLLFLQTNFAHLIAIRNIAPDFILIFVLIVSYRDERSTATAVGFFAGLFQDLFTTRFFGLSALTKSIIGFTGQFFHQPEKTYNLPHYIMSFSTLIIIHELIYQTIFSLGKEIGFFELLIYATIPRSFYTLIVAMIVYFIFNEKLWKP